MWFLLGIFFLNYHSYNISEIIVLENYLTQKDCYAESQKLQKQNIVKRGRRSIKLEHVEYRCVFLNKGEQNGFTR